MLMVKDLMNDLEPGSKERLSKSFFKVREYMKQAVPPRFGPYQPWPGPVNTLTGTYGQFISPSSGFGSAGFTGSSLAWSSGTADSGLT